MPFSIKNIFTASKGHVPEISGPIHDKPVPGNCTLTSTTVTIKDYMVCSRWSCGFDMRPPGAGDRTPQLKLSASELTWLSKTIDTERNNIKE
ncbi:secretion protein EspO [Escherichia albertii]|uniref:secretion protein EspO n=1 Tax=Escherichia albertii TaxID=208962 RepID=UPI002360C4F2|nr:secretion protein EspO [Escherichia albertii]WDB26885.1 secretion protein EspO [Escherichia albertii]WDB50111.1 secretion protein EspO [Escherichia albertii]